MCVWIGKDIHLKHESSINGAMLTKDLVRLLTWSKDKTARLWEVKTGKPIGPPLKHDNNVTGASFNAKETSILTWGEDGTVKVWDTSTGRQIGVTS